jgi:hypothetical protein
MPDFLANLEKVFGQISTIKSPKKGSVYETLNHDKSIMTNW